MLYNQYQITAKVWLYSGDSAWHFISIPKEQSEEIATLFSDKKRGWGSFKVTATIGVTSWKTSIFPDKKSGEFLLPLKVEVRKKEGIVNGDTVAVVVEIEL